VSTSSGRLLGIDFGTRRIGLAISDPKRRIATPLEVYERQTTERDAAHFMEIIQNWEICALVIGLPLHTTGQAGIKVQQTKSFAGWLAKVSERPIFFWDERFTTSQASQRKERIDSIDAQILLQDYLDAGCPSKPEVENLDSD
jgi:putative Holliday junction resolvase